MYANRYGPIWLDIFLCTWYQTVGLVFYIFWLPFMLISPFPGKKLFAYFPIIQYANHSLSSWTPVVVWPVSHGAIVVGRALQYPARAIVLEVIWTSTQCIKMGIELASCAIYLRLNYNCPSSFINQQLLFPRKTNATHYVLRQQDIMGYDTYKISQRPGCTNPAKSKVESKHLMKLESKPSVITELLLVR